VNHHEAGDDRPQSTITSSVSDQSFTTIRQPSFPPSFELVINRAPRKRSAIGFQMGFEDVPGVRLCG
jgi:hypothetical protein